MSFDEVMSWIAQGAVNVAEGHTTIEAGSPVHRAMLALCEYVNAGRVGLVPPPPMSESPAVLRGLLEGGDLPSSRDSFPSDCADRGE